MDNQSYSIAPPIPFKHISVAKNEIVKYIDDRRNNLVSSLKTKWAKFNNACMGGIEPNAIYTFTGISGSGKSSLVNTLETDLIDLNKSENTIILSFNFEMLSSKQVGRKLSYKLKKTTSELYSTTSNISDDEFKIIENSSKQFDKYPIYYVDIPSSIKEIEDTIIYFNKTIAKDKWLIVMLDHTLLVRSNNSSSDMQTIVDLQKMFMRVKKIGKTSILQISQMNRNIEQPERINNNFLHFPIRSDLSTSDSIYQASDYIIVIHRPEVLGIVSYGPNHLPVIDHIYLHIIKNREGEVKILKFLNDLKHNNIIEPESLPQDVK